MLSVILTILILLCDSRIMGNKKKNKNTIYPSSLKLEAYSYELRPLNLIFMYFSDINRDYADHYSAFLYFSKKIKENDSE